MRNPAPEPMLACASRTATNTATVKILFNSTSLGLRPQSCPHIYIKKKLLSSPIFPLFPLFQDQVLATQRCQHPLVDVGYRLKRGHEFHRQRDIARRLCLSAEQGVDDIGPAQPELMAEIGRSRQRDVRPEVAFADRRGEGL